MRCTVGLPRGDLRTLSHATFVNTIGTGLWAAGVALFLTRYAQLSVGAVGAALTVAGLVGLTASVPLGHLADRRDPRTLRALIQLLQAGVAAAYLLVDSFGVLLVVAAADAVLVSGNLAVRAALVAAVAGPTRRVRAFAALRAVANAGISVGALLAGLALAADTRTGYALLAAGNCLTYLLSAALLMRLPPRPRASASSCATSATGTPLLAALRDRPFLAVGAACAVLSTHRTVLVIIVPLWIVDRTGAAPWTISLLLVTNTVLTVLLAVALSRGATSAGRAARAVRRGAILLAVAMLGYASTANRSPTVTIVLLLLATVVHTVGDLLQSTGAAGLSYDLAPPTALGQYQGASVMVTGLAEAVAPALLILLVLDGGGAGHWAVLSVVFVVAGSAVGPLTRLALRRSAIAGPAVPA